jgi:hypothetical protein
MKLKQLVFVFVPVIAVFMYSQVKGFSPLPPPQISCPTADAYTPAIPGTAYFDIVGGVNRCTVKNAYIFDLASRVSLDSIYVLRAVVRSYAGSNSAYSFECSGSYNVGGITRYINPRTIGYSCATIQRSDFNDSQILFTTEYAGEQPTASGYYRSVPQ